MTVLRVVAVDLGAGSGRVVAVTVGEDQLELVELHRFTNDPVTANDALHWNVAEIQREVLTGLRTAAATGPVDGIGIDSWAVDFGLLDAAGNLLGLPRSYRDVYGRRGANRLRQLVDAEEIYSITGIQEQPFNTVCQLLALAESAALASVHTFLLMPDLIGYWLTGMLGAEKTNASTTQLFDICEGTWAWSLIARLGLPTSAFPSIRESGSLLGRVLPEISADTGLDPGVPVLTVCSHDTASAVVAVPADEPDFAYISSGTWSLVGIERTHPVLTAAARTAGYTNEVGIEGTVRLLRNVTGLWLLSESLREWQPDPTVDELLSAAEGVPPLSTVIDVDDFRLQPATGGDVAPMPTRIATLAAEMGESVPCTPAEFVRCILDSMVVAYRRHIRMLSEVGQQNISTIHLVGGGSQVGSLCQLTADATGRSVLAGPTEATALGNALVQARALGVALPTRHAMRRLVRATQPLRRYEPRSSHDWAVAEERVFRNGSKRTDSARFAVHLDDGP